LEPLVCAGLGNPGSEYEETRHNVGFRVAEELVRRHGARFRLVAGSAAVARCTVKGAPLLVVKPLTYMNNSGEALLEALAATGVLPDRLAVVVDDLDLPLGTLRLRPSGGHGGHNGLRSVIGAVGSGEFFRVRCGIGVDPKPRRDETADYVLSPFARGERAAAEEMVGRAADAVETLAVSGPAAAMNSFNTQH
jgi:PTH1 family peptidyl-tRNA hydrolase